MVKEVRGTNRLVSLVSLQARSMCRLHWSMFVNRKSTRRANVGVSRASVPDADAALPALLPHVLLQEIATTRREGSGGKSLVRKGHQGRGEEEAERRVQEAIQARGWHQHRYEAVVYEGSSM